MNLFAPQILEEVDSQYSGQLKVISRFGNKYIATGYWTQSGGIIKDLWFPLLKKISKTRNLDTSTWLILGLGAGSVAQLISQNYRSSKIVGVEIDPEMIRLGKKYFSLDKIPHLEIVNLDARRYVLEAKQKYDFTLVDLYLGDNLPSFVYSEKFLRHLKNISNLIVFNHLFCDELKRRQAKELVKKLEQYFNKIELVRKLTNLLIVARAKPKD